MSIQVRCASCGKRSAAPDEMAGEQAKCSHCGAVVTVPSIFDAIQPLDDFSSELDGSDDLPIGELVSDPSFEGFPDSRPPARPDPPADPFAGLMDEALPADEPVTLGSPLPRSSAKRRKPHPASRMQWEEPSSAPFVMPGRGLLRWIGRHKLLTAVLVINVICVFAAHDFAERVSAELPQKMASMAANVFAVLIVVPGLVVIGLAMLPSNYGVRVLVAKILAGLMVVIHLWFQGGGPRGSQDKVMQIRLVDVAGGETVWISDPLTSRQVSEAYRAGKDPAETLVADVLEKVDANFALDSMPT